MHWSMVGWSHHRTPLELREKLAFTSQQVQEALLEFNALHAGAEAVLLSTCNRVELYCAAETASKLPSSEQLGAFIAKRHQLDFGDVREQATCLTGIESLQHLFMVASSLDSMIVGEAQILSQVKSAYELACSTDSASSLMHRAFQRATAIARRVANETTIHQRRISVPSVAVSEIATEFFERFDDKRILLIGAGEMGTETLRYLVDAGAKRIRIVNRNAERAVELAEQFGATTDSWTTLEQHVAEADLIVSTTSATSPVITCDQFKQIRARRAHAVLILDLAVPRDFEAGIAKFPDTYLYTVDDLQQVCDRNIQARQKEWPKAIQIVEQETQRFVSESRHAGSGQTIKRLREQAEQVKQEEFQRLIAKLKARGIDEQTEKELAISFDRLVNKILHPPLQSLREHADSSNHATLLESLRRLFQIND